MTDVFISYASEDRARAEMLAGALAARGWSVWWDRKIITGQAFDQAIEHALETASSVVVLWSRHAIASEWVKNEAAVAAERGVLVPGMIESVKLPLEFRRKQTADLTDWQGEASHSGFQALCAGVSAALGGATGSGALQQATPARPDEKLHRGPPWGWAAIAAFSVAAGLGVYGMAPWRTMQPAPTTQSGRSQPGSPSESKAASNAVAGLADFAAGTYDGDVISDSKGSSRSDIALTVTRIDRWSVRVTSDYRRLGTVDVTLTRAGDKIISAQGDTAFFLDMGQTPPTLEYAPHGELAYQGRQRR